MPLVHYIACNLRGLLNYQADRGKEYMLAKANEKITTI